MKKEIDQSTLSGNIYRAPTTLRKRLDTPLNRVEIQPNEEATGMELHKDSKYVPNGLYLSEMSD